MASLAQSTTGEGSPEPHDLSVEDRAFGRYRLRMRLARGGMATVYLAEHRTSDGFQKWLAIKIIHPHFADDPTFVTMFHDEARLAARFDHPNICTVFDFGHVDDTYYIAMEYLQGEPLGNLIRRGGPTSVLPLEIAVGLVTDIARGLHAAHELRGADGANAEVVHRDVSPQNIFVLYSGQSKIVDFGVARFNDRVQRTLGQHVKGKPGYLAPEQLSGGVIDRRTDVFSLGIVLWEAIASTRLFRAASEAATMAAVMSKDVAPPSSAQSRCPPALDEIVLRALARDPEGRYQTADEFASALERFARGWSQPIGTRETSAWMREAFKPEIRAREELLRKLSTTSSAPKALDALKSTAITSASLPETATDLPIAATAQRSPGRARWTIVVVAAGVVFAAAAMIAVMTARNIDGREQVSGDDRTVHARVVAPPAVASPSAAPPPPAVSLPQASPEPPPAVEARPTRSAAHHEAHHSDGPAARPAPLRPMHAYPGGS